jgi:hypothetical protein
MRSPGHDHTSLEGVTEKLPNDWGFRPGPSALHCGPVLGLHCGLGCFVFDSFISKLFCSDLVSAFTSILYYMWTTICGTTADSKLVVSKVPTDFQKTTLDIPIPKCISKSAFGKATLIFLPI